MVSTSAPTRETRIPCSEIRDRDHEASGLPRMYKQLIRRRSGPRVTASGSHPVGSAGQGTQSPLRGSVRQVARPHPKVREPRFPRRLLLLWRPRIVCPDVPDVAFQIETREATTAVRFILD